MTLDDILTDLLEREGWPKVTKHTWDRGGFSKGPITLATLVQWRGRPVSLWELKKLKEKEAREILTRRYVHDPRFHLIEERRLQLFMIDYGVHSGPVRAIEDLQHAIFTDIKDVDGRLGLRTLAALKAADAGEVYRRVFLARWELLENLVFRDDALVYLLLKHDEVKANGWRPIGRELRAELPPSDADEGARGAFLDRWIKLENQVRDDPPLVEWLASEDAAAAQMHNWRGWMNRLRLFLP